MNNQRRRRISADTPSPRPMMNNLRTHASFCQTTDCTMSPTVNYHYVQSPSMTSTTSSMGDSGIEPAYSFGDSFSRQSTVGSASIDEGVEFDFASTCPDSNVAAAVRQDFLSNSDCSTTSSINDSPFESFDSQIESDVMSSLSSCPQSSSTSVSLAYAMTFSITSSTTPPSSSHALTPGSDSVSTPWENSPSVFAQQAFREGFRASDNMMFDSCTHGFPAQLQLIGKTKGVTELNKKTDKHKHFPVHAAVYHQPYYPFPIQPGGMMPLYNSNTYNGAAAQTNPAQGQGPNSVCMAVPHLSEAFKAIRLPGSEQSKRTMSRQRPPLPKRISLPENLEFQPHKLLTMKQSRHVEKQLERKTPDEFVVALQQPLDVVGQTSTSYMQQNLPYPILTPPNPAILNETTTPASKTAFLHQQRLHLYQKRQILQKQTRRQILRQASYQMAQKQSVMPGNEIMNVPAGHDLLCLPNDSFFHEDNKSILLHTPLSPIEDASNNCEKEQEDSMDTT